MERTVIDPIGNSGHREKMSFIRSFTTHTISWNITRRCNLACSHCYLDADFRSGEKVDELSTEKCIAILDQIAAVNPNTLLILTGGEPLLRSDLYKIVREATERGFMVVVGSNGTALTESNVAKLKAAGVQGMSLSLHSLDPDTHDRFVQVPGSWERTVAGLHRLASSGMEFILQMSVASWNSHELESMAAFALENGARVFNVYFLVCTGRGQGMTDIRPDEYESTLARLYLIQQHYQDRLLIGAKCTPQYKRVVYSHDPDSPHLKTYLHGCPAATHYAQITPEGHLTPCPYMPIPVGNLLEADFETIWWGAPLLKELRDRDLLEGRCGACEFKRLCSGCRARAYAESRNYLAEDPSCLYQPGAFGGDPITLEAPETFGLPVQRDLSWSPEAESRLSKIPTFARGMVASAVERWASERGHSTVTEDLLSDARGALVGRFGPMTSFGRGGSV
jgi:radical SAM protein with 4Fe4S-binding SPASM domain